jgi:hypothetical protein
MSKKEPSEESSDEAYETEENSQSDESTDSELYEHVNEDIQLIKETIDKKKKTELSLLFDKFSKHISKKKINTKKNVN